MPGIKDVDKSDMSIVHARHIVNFISTRLRIIRSDSIFGDRLVSTSTEAVRRYRRYLLGIPKFNAFTA